MSTTSNVSRVKRHAAVMIAATQLNAFLYKAPRKDNRPKGEAIKLKAQGGDWSEADTTNFNWFKYDYRVVIGGVEPSAVLTSDEANAIRAKLSCAYGLINQYSTQDDINKAVVELDAVFDSLN